MIGHVHTAGNPGRGELDDKQEINYPPIMKALLDIKYKAFVGQEFIPTRDPVKGLDRSGRALRCVKNKSFLIALFSSPDYS
jgi:hydroxypyruvate isomerase